MFHEVIRRLHYLSVLACVVQQVLVDASESAGEEPAESLLLARMAYVSGSSKTESLRDETAFESFWLPPGSGIVSRETSFMSGNLTSEDAALCQEGGREFLSFRVANRDNEVKSGSRCIIFHGTLTRPRSSVLTHFCTRLQRHTCCTSKLHRGVACQRKCRNSEA